jgi:hypothetical protein
MSSERPQRSQSSRGRGRPSKDYDAEVKFGTTAAWKNSLKNLARSRGISVPDLLNELIERELKSDKKTQGVLLKAAS